MNGDDGRSEPEWPIDRRQPAGNNRNVTEKVSTTSSRRGITPILIALAVVVAVLALVWIVAGRGNSDQDKLTGNGIGSNSLASDPEKNCSSKQTYDLIKRQLFSAAAQTRGSDDAAFERLSSYAVLRMDNPVMESEDKAIHAVNCSGSLSIDLPPGVAVSGGRRTIASDVDYTVQPAADGSGNVVRLRNADSIIGPLATLGRIEAPPNQQQQVSLAPVSGSPSVVAGSAPSNAGEPSQAPADQMPSGPSAATQPAQPAPASAHPSFDCAKARTKSELAVCSDSGLAALDRKMAAQYVRSISNASPDQQALLRKTRDRFLAYRDRCPTRSCIGDAYVGRIREIRDIMAGTWSPPE